MPIPPIRPPPLRNRGVNFARPGFCNCAKGFPQEEDKPMEVKIFYTRTIASMARDKGKRSLRALATSSPRLIIPLTKNIILDSFLQ